MAESVPSARLPARYMLPPNWAPSVHLSFSTSVATSPTPTCPMLPSPARQVRPQGPGRSISAAVGEASTSTADVGRELQYGCYMCIS
ncbi:hypothetical protein OH76DRAFT_1413539 [Lentinus brumalis]|uniref:Uncharacterized protein n=1 Tax=Lentinus brumalis TaxID=2498619 RepID=A0A371CGH5_9APHY|nr:hypothetical protein OH76DRAFT_1413539 [Polyporus brumalis]